MRTALIAAVVAVWSGGLLSAESVMPLNLWIEVKAPAAQLSLEGMPQLGVAHYYVERVSLAPGASYTLVAEWGDGKPPLVMVRGHDPRQRRQPEPPPGAGSGAVLSAAGVSAARPTWCSPPESRAAAYG